MLSRSVSTRRALARVATLLSIPVILIASSSLARSAVADFWSSCELQYSMEEVAERGRRLDEEDATVRQRIVVKEALIDQLIEGNMTLADVTTAFLQLDQDRPASSPSIRSILPGKTDQEKLIKNVMTYIEMRIPDKNHLAKVMLRLDDERARMCEPASLTGR